MVSKGWQRAAHREIDAILSNAAQPVRRHERAEPLREGEIVPVRVALRPHATRFRKGEQPRNFGDDGISLATFCRGPFPARYQACPKGRWTFHTGGEFDAHVLIGTRAIRNNM